MTADALGKLVDFVSPIVTELAPAIIGTIRAEVEAHQAITAEQRMAMLDKLEATLDADKTEIDALTANAKPDPIVAVVVSNEPA